MRNSYPDLRDRFQSGSQPTLNSVILWSLPPYSQISSKSDQCFMRTPANKHTDKQKILATQRFELSTLAVLAQCSYRLSYRVVIIRLLLSDYYYSPNSPNFMKIRPVVHVKQLSGSQIRISIRITPNLELGLPMIITSLLTKYHHNPTSSLWEILLTKNN